MAFEKLLGSAESLMSQMRRNGFSDSYRTEVMTEIRWLSRRGRECESLEEACLIRCGELGTPGTVRKAMAIFGLLKYFEMHGDCSNPEEGHTLFEREARLGLMPCFCEGVDAFSEAGLARGLRLSTVSRCASDYSKPKRPSFQAIGPPFRASAPVTDTGTPYGLTATSRSVLRVQPPSSNVLGTTMGYSTSPSQALPKASIPDDRVPSPSISSKCVS